MSFKPWTDPAYLEDRYVKKKMTIDQIAAEAGCSKSTIDAYLDKFGLKKNRRSR